MALVPSLSRDIMSDNIRKCNFLLMCLDGSTGEETKVPSSDGKQAVNYETVNLHLCNEFGKKVVEFQKDTLFNYVF
jgi:hypothetical protein